MQEIQQKSKKNEWNQLEIKYNLNINQIEMHELKQKSNRNQK